MHGEKWKILVSHRYPALQLKSIDDRNGTQENSQPVEYRCQYVPRLEVINRIECPHGKSRAKNPCPFPQSSLMQSIQDPLYSGVCLH